MAKIRYLREEGKICGVDLRIISKLLAIENVDGDL
jgi:hypothetical protein